LGSVVKIVFPIDEKLSVEIPYIYSPELRFDNPGTEISLNAAAIMVVE